jgi:hypothetical protein
MFGGLLLLSSHTTLPTAVEDMVMALLPLQAGWETRKMEMILGITIQDHLCLLSYECFQPTKSQANLRQLRENI